MTKGTLVGPFLGEEQGLNLRSRQVHWRSQERDCRCQRQEQLEHSLSGRVPVNLGAKDPKSETRTISARDRVVLVAQVPVFSLIAGRASR